MDCDSLMESISDQVAELQQRLSKPNDPDSETPLNDTVEVARKQPFIIGVAGGTASGKTTVCDMIIARLHDQRVVLINQESFYFAISDEKLKDIHEHNFDHPEERGFIVAGSSRPSKLPLSNEAYLDLKKDRIVQRMADFAPPRPRTREEGEKLYAFDTELLLSCMEKLKAGHPTTVPNYDSKTITARLPPRQVNPSDVIILEGILVLHDPRVRGLMNMKIFVDTDSDLRLARRIKRDTVERGRDVQYILDQYSKFVKPGFEEFVLPSMKYADIIIPRGADNEVAIDLIVQHIQVKFGQHDLCKIYPNLCLINSTFQIRGMHTLIRDVNTTTDDFVFYADRLIRLVVEHGLGHLPFNEKQVVTPTETIYTGVVFCRKICGVSIVRSGESMENALRACCKGIRIGKILIHGDRTNGRQLIYEHLPDNISDRHVLLLDPVLVTGNSAIQAISLLISRGVPEANIILLSLISAPEGIHALCKKFPLLKVVTSEIETGMNSNFQVIPGMGEFGDRYFGTDDM